MSREAFNAKCNAKISNLPPATIEAFVQDALSSGVPLARKKHKLDRYVAARIFSAAKAAIKIRKTEPVPVPASPVTAPRADEAKSWAWLLNTASLQAKLALHAVEPYDGKGYEFDGGPSFRRDGELTTAELRRNGKCKFGFAWQWFSEVNRRDLPHEMRPLRDKFLKLCQHTFAERSARRREYVRRIGWLPKEKPSVPTFREWLDSPAMLPPVHLPTLPTAV